MLICFICVTVKIIDYDISPHKTQSALTKAMFRISEEILKVSKKTHDHEHAIIFRVLPLQYFFGNSCQSCGAWRAQPYILSLVFSVNYSTEKKLHSWHLCWFSLCSSAPSALGKFTINSLYRYFLQKIRSSFNHVHYYFSTGDGAPLSWLVSFLNIHCHKPYVFSTLTNTFNCAAFIYIYIYIIYIYYIVQVVQSKFKRMTFRPVNPLYARFFINLNRSPPF